eukprot:833624-Rhodomonas_salina.1
MPAAQVWSVIQETSLLARAPLLSLSTRSAVSIAAPSIPRSTHTPLTCRGTFRCSSNHLANCTGADSRRSSCCLRTRRSRCR